jgi:hypothetical protein
MCVFDRGTLDEQENTNTQADDTVIDPSGSEKASAKQTKGDEQRDPGRKQEEKTIRMKEQKVIVL